MNITMQNVWEAMKKDDYGVTLRNMVLQQGVLQDAKDVDVFRSLFQLDVAIPFVILLWHLQNDETPDDLQVLIADCLSYNQPLHVKKTAVTALINYWLKRDGLPLL